MRLVIMTIKQLLPPYAPLTTPTDDNIQALADAADYVQPVTGFCKKVPSRYEYIIWGVQNESLLYLPKIQKGKTVKNNKKPKTLRHYLKKKYDKKARIQTVDLGSGLIFFENIAQPHRGQINLLMIQISLDTKLIYQG